MIRKLTTPFVVNGRNQSYCCGRLVCEGRFVVIQIAENTFGAQNYDVYVARAKSKYRIKDTNEHDYLAYLKDESTVFYLWKRCLGGYEIEYDLAKPIQATLSKTENNGRPKIEAPQEGDDAKRFAFDLPESVVQDQ